MPATFLRLPLDKLRPLWYNTRVIRVRVVYTDYTKNTKLPKGRKNEYCYVRHGNHLHHQAVCL